MIMEKNEKEKFIVRTCQGKLIGTTYTSELNDVKYYCFLGIPYAKPPVNTLRFMPPEPVERWIGIRDATKEGNDCLHYSVFHKKIVGSEDCLYLNIYCPRPPREIEVPKAVIVNLHGGGNAWGSGSSMLFGAPDFLVHHDVIFVAINFRLHVFGFLNLGLQNCAGNMGMKDQVMALRWIKKNIQFFGGDPEKITIHGGSSGASNAHLHTLSPLSQGSPNDGLFNNVILQCGFALNYWAYQAVPHDSIQQLAELMNFHKVDNYKRLIRLLKQASAEAIHEAYMKLFKSLKENMKGEFDVCIFTVTVESFSEGAFLYQSPRDLIFSPRSHNISFLAGLNDVEGLFALTTRPLESTLKQIVRNNLRIYKISEDTLDIIVDKINKFYFNTNKFGPEALAEICDLYTDMWFAEWQEFLDFESSVNQATTYVYFFTYDGRSVHHFTPALEMKPKSGASHSEDLFHTIFFKNFFGDAKFKRKTFNKDELKVIENMGKIVTNFAKSNNPKVSNEENQVWEIHHSDNPRYAEINQLITPKTGIILHERQSFWKGIIKLIKENEL